MKYMIVRTLKEIHERVTSHTVIGQNLSSVTATCFDIVMYDIEDLESAINQKYHLTSIKDERFIILPYYP